MEFTRQSTTSKRLKHLRFCAVAGVSLLVSYQSASAQIVAPPPSVEVNLQALEKLRGTSPAPQNNVPSYSSPSSTSTSSSKNAGSLGTIRLDSNGNTSARQPVNSNRQEINTPSNAPSGGLLLRPLGSEEDIIGTSGSKKSYKKTNPKPKKRKVSAPKAAVSAAPLATPIVAPEPIVAPQRPEPVVPAPDMPSLPAVPEPVPAAPVAVEPAPLPPAAPVAEMPALPDPVSMPPAPLPPMGEVPAPNQPIAAPVDSGLPPMPPVGDMPPAPPSDGTGITPALDPMTGMPITDVPAVDPTTGAPIDPMAAPSAPPMEGEMPVAEAPAPVSDEVAPPPPPMVAETSFLDDILDSIADIWNSIMETIQGWLGNEPAKPLAPAAAGPDDMPAPPGPDDMPPPAPMDGMPSPMEAPADGIPPLTELGPDGQPLPLPPAAMDAGASLPPMEGMPTDQAPALPASPELLPPPTEAKTENSVALPVPALKPSNAPSQPSEVPATNLKTQAIKAEPKTVKVDNKTQKSVPVPEVGNAELPPIGAMPELPALPESVPDKAANAIPELPPLPAIAAPATGAAPALSEQLDVVEQKSSTDNISGNAAAKISFAADEKQVPATAQAQLQSIAETLKKDTTKKVRLVAHASGNKDQAPAARRIALARALATRAAFIDLGVENYRIDVQAKGNETSNADRVDVFVE